jgi:photosystem II protein
MGVRLAAFCGAFAFLALAGSFAETPTPKLFKQPSGGPTGVGLRALGLDLPPPPFLAWATSSRREEQKTTFLPPALAWVPPMVAICCGMAIGTVAVGYAVGYPRRMPRVFPLESLQFAAIEFIVGETEHCVPDVKLTRSPDGRVSTAVFTFDSPAILSNQADGEMTGMHLKDEEGTISTKDVNAQFVNGRPRVLVARVVLNGFDAWDRFMRWMDRYAKVNGLAFTPAKLAMTPASSLADFSPLSSFNASFNSMADALHDNGRLAYA